MKTSKNFPRVNLMPDRGGWVTARENDALHSVLTKIGFPVSRRRIAFGCINYLSTRYFAAEAPRWYLNINSGRNVFDYYHGDPRVSPDQSDILKKIQSRKECFMGIRVSNTRIAGLMSDIGFKGRLSIIPIGIDYGVFEAQHSLSKIDIRRKYGIPIDAVCVGSFQKDGVGWGDGEDPKYIKGPDIFLKTMGALYPKCKQLYVILTGPSRGYLSAGLRSLGLPYLHIDLQNYLEIAKVYRALDFYLITSREEGGPKGLLEAMAAGVPVVTTPVGQAIDLVMTGLNGLMANSFSPDELADLCMNLLQMGSAERDSLTEKAMSTAREGDYNMQSALWQDFLSL